jgi:hypothetical protein
MRSEHQHQPTVLSFGFRRVTLLCRCLPVISVLQCTFICYTCIETKPFLCIEGRRFPRYNEPLMKRSKHKMMASSECTPPRICSPYTFPPQPRANSRGALRAPSAVFVLHARRLCQCVPAAAARLAFEVRFFRQPDALLLPPHLLSAGPLPPHFFKPKSVVHSHPPAARWHQAAAR